MWVICADSDEEAQRLAASRRMAFMLLRRGQLIAVPPPQEALEFLAADERDAASRRALAAARGPGIAADGARGSSRRSSRATAREEAIVVSITYEHEARRRSYELLAEAFALELRSPSMRPPRSRSAA